MDSESVIIYNPGHRKIWYRYYDNENGSSFLGSDFEENTDTIRTSPSEYTIFAWKNWNGIDSGFEAEGFMPVSNGDEITFYEDSVENSHYVLFLGNRTSGFVRLRALYDDNGIEFCDVDIKSGEDLRWRISSKAKNLSIMFTEELGNKFEPQIVRNFNNGQTLLFEDGEMVTQKELQLNLPVHDIPIKIINKSGEQVLIRAYTDESLTNWSFDYVKENAPPYVMFLGSHPYSIGWSYSSREFDPVEIIPYTRGITITMRSRKEIELGIQDEKVFELLKSLNWIERYGRQFVESDLDYEGILDLSDSEMKDIGLAIGSAKKLRREIIKIKSEKKLIENQQTKEEIQEVSGYYDAFLSHKQLNGADLAQAIKLQLEIVNPNLKIFLDTDDLEKIHKLDDNVKNSKNFILLITDGVLERPWVQFEIRAALKCNKNIILVHDERNCPFPSGNYLKSIPEDVTAVLSVKSIPYYREKVFRAISIQQIFSKMVGV
jgi:hypothetical protein